jgi:hypothetical protein
MIAGDRPARLWALAIGMGSLLGMIPPLIQAIGVHGGLLAGAWALLRYFTIWTNLLVGAVFLTIAWRGRDAVSPFVLGGVMLAILLVGVVFNLVLGQIPQPSWWLRIGDSLHHHVAPLAVPLWWLVFGCRGQLNARAPLLWALYPLIYSGYILVRAGLEPASLPRRYPYFFLDVETLGWPSALLHMGAISAGFILMGLAIVAIDRRLARPRS